MILYIGVIHFVSALFWWILLILKILEEKKRRQLNFFPKNFSYVFKSFLITNFFLNLLGYWVLDALDCMRGKERYNSDFDLILKVAEMMKYR